MPHDTRALQAWLGHSRTSSTRFAIPSLRRTGSRTSGANQAEKRDVEKGWELVELHGPWWAYRGELPPPEAFETHGRSPHGRYGH